MDLVYRFLLEELSGGVKKPMVQQKKVEYGDGRRGVTSSRLYNIIFTSEEWLRRDFGASKALIRTVLQNTL